MADKISNPIDVIKGDIGDIMHKRGLEFQRVYDNSGIICDPEKQQVKYLVTAEMEDSYTVKLSIIQHLMGSEDKDLTMELMGLRSKL